MVADWVAYLRTEKLWGLEDPLFPSTLMAQATDQKFEPSGLARKSWSNATPIRRIFKTAFDRARLPPVNPHSFRKTLALLGQQICPNAEALKAWSQNLGHNGVLTTLTSYGQVPTHRQAEIFRDLRSPKRHPDTMAELLEHLAREARAGRLQSGRVIPNDPSFLLEGGEQVGIEGDPTEKLPLSRELAGE
jgi:hypothetical protein